MESNDRNVRNAKRVKKLNDKEDLKKPKGKYKDVFKETRPADSVGVV